ncbi:MAG: PKD domain-containing protein, partial [Euryarchaeota archaeon]|nr:PKD domain-containing protein [Euryarchaeota archaeon]
GAGLFNATVSSLIDGTYSYVACGEGDDLIAVEVCGDEVEFIISTIPPSSPIVLTVPVTIFTSNSAILNGQVVYLGSETPINAFFEYSENLGDIGTSAALTTEDKPITMTDTIGSFSSLVSDLKPNTEYHYIACARPTEGEPVCDVIKSFTTEAPRLDGKFRVVATGEPHVSITPSVMRIVDPGREEFIIRDLPGSRCEYVDITNQTREVCDSTLSVLITGDTIVKAEGFGLLGVVKPAFIAIEKDSLSVEFYDMSARLRIPEVARTWDFGDGTRSTQLNPEKTYAAPGRYAVTLWVKDAYNSGTLTQYIDVGVVQPTETFTITARGEHGGRITPYGETPVEQGSSITYSIYPNNGYSIKEVFVDEFNIGNPSTYTFSDVQQSHTIRATFQWN